MLHHSPTVDRDLQAQFIHEEPHYVVTFPMKLQGSPVILRSPLKMRKADEDRLPTLCLFPADWAPPLPRDTREPIQDFQDVQVAHLPHLPVSSHLWPGLRRKL